MQRAILIVIIAVIILIVLWGIYFIITTSQNKVVPNQQQSGQGSYDIQGMKVTVLKQGTGTAAKNGDQVTVNYTGTLANGTKFDSSYDRNAPFTFTLGAGSVIKGWDLGVVGMKVGEKRQLVIPPDLAYGQNGFLNVIPANATLTFQVEMVKITPASGSK